MRKIIAILLMLGTLLSFSSCKKDKEYDPVPSTEEESRTVMTLSIDEDTYEVKYELYRAFFLTYKNEIDGGNPDVWQSDEKDLYIDRINEKILERVCEIYSAFAICKRIGFDIYSKDVESKIKENIKISVEGGSYGTSAIEGFDSYEEYLEALKSMNLNYSVQALLFRYAIAVDAIDRYYIGTATSDDVNIDLTIGAIEYTKNDVRTFYYGDECVRVLRTNFQKIISYEPLEKAYALKAQIEEAANSKDTPEEKENAVVGVIMSNGLYSNSAEIQSGYVIGKYNLERSYYGEMTDAAFDLNEGQVSSPIDIVTDIEDSYYILYRTYKSDSHFESEYESILYIFLMNYVGKISHGVAEELKSGVNYTDVYNSIVHSEIRM